MNANPPPSGDKLSPWRALLYTVKYAWSSLEFRVEKKVDRYNTTIIAVYGFFFYKNVFFQSLKTDGVNVEKRTVCAIIIIILNRFVVATSDVSVRRTLVCATATFPLSIRNLLAAPKRLFYTICRRILPPSDSLFSSSSYFHFQSFLVLSSRIYFVRFLVNFTSAITARVAVATRLVGTTRDAVSFLLFFQIR